MSGLAQDVRYALRTLIRSPLFTAVAVLTLGLGIGANTAIFSVINAVLLEPLRYRDPGRLVSIKGAFPGMGFEKFWVSAPEYLELQEWNRAFAAVGGYRTVSRSIDTDVQPLRVTAAVATYDLFEALGVDAALGRTFTRDEDLPGGDPAVVISHGLWTRAYGADPATVGRTVMVDGVATRIVGVMPERFDIEDAGVEVWQPLQLDPAAPGGRASHYLYLVGRLNPGVSIPQAEADVGALVATWSDRVPGQHTPSPDGHPFVITDLHEELVGGVQSQLWILLGAVGFVLLIACANVGNLLLARAESRQKEVAVRVAMGAPRRRLVRQFLTESIVLALLGGIVGVAMAWGGLEILLAASPGSVPRLQEITIDGGVLGVTVAIAVLTGVLFGLAPILHLTGRQVGNSIREGGARTTAGGARQRIRKALVVAEVALAVILVVGSGLMIRSLGALLDVDPGFRSENLLTWQMLLPAAGYPNAAEQTGFYDQLMANVAGLPGVEAAAIMSGLPPRRNVNANDTEFEGIDFSEENGPRPNVDYYQTVSANYFDVMDIPIVMGRGFDSSDEVSDHPVAIVNEQLVRTFYDGENPLGRRIRPCCGDSTPWLEIVGVAKDVKQGGLESATGTELYFNYAQSGNLAGFTPRNMNVVVRTVRTPAPLASAMRSEVARLDATLPLAGLQTMDDNLSGSLARPRFLATLLAVFAGLALALAAVGTYGVVSYFVAERNREIGIRMAMGAESGNVLAMVLKHGGGLALGGLSLGLLGAFSLSRVMESVVFGIATTDAATYALAPTVLAVVAVLACYIPARRATRVDPAVVLREE